MPSRLEKSSSIREAITNLLKNYDQPLGLERLWQLVRVTQPRTAFSTVFRIVRRLEEQKLVIRVDWRERGSRYEWADRQHHHHIHCTICGTSTDIDDSVIQFDAARVRSLTGFSFANHHVVLEGVCEHCQAKTDH